MEQNILEDKIKNWHEVKLESYKIIIDLAKERFSEVVSESESITDKSFRILGIIGAYFTVLGYYVSSNKQVLEFVNIPIAVIVFVFMLISLTSIFWFFKLILPKFVINKGLPPLVVMPDHVDSKDDFEHQEKMLQYNIVVSYQNNIVYMSSQNEKRAKVYTKALISFYLFVCGLPFSAVCYLITIRLLCQ